VFRRSLFTPRTAQQAAWLATMTVGEDKAYDTADHVANLRALNVTPHVVRNDSISAGRAPSTDAPRGTKAMAYRNRAG
jgi:hypothetical protein